MPTVSESRVRSATRSRKASLRPWCAATVNGCSLPGVTSQSPALSASNRERVRSTTSPRTAARSRLPVSSFVTDRSARARCSSRRARPSRRVLASVVATVDASDRRKAADRTPDDSGSSTSTPTGPRLVPSTSAMSSPSATGSARGRRRGVEPGVRGQVEGLGLADVHGGTLDAELGAQRLDDGSGDRGGRRRGGEARGDAAEDGELAAALVVGIGRGGRLVAGGAVLDEQPLDVAAAEAPVAARVDAVGGQPAGIGPGADRVGVHAEQRRRLGDGQERVGIVARHRPSLLRVNGASGKNRAPDARNGMCRARCPVGTDLAPTSVPVASS